MNSKDEEEQRQGGIDQEEVITDMQWRKGFLPFDEECSPILSFVGESKKRNEGALWLIFK